MNRRIGWLLAVLSFWPALGVAAGDGTAAVKRIREVMAGLVPDRTPDVVRPAPVTGFYEVDYGPQVFYVTADGRYLLRGDIMDLQHRRNLTEARKNGLRRDTLARIPPDQMISFPAKYQKHVVTVFTDIDCGYCRKLHGQIDKYNDLGITVNYLFFPRAGRNSSSYYKAISVWCAKDRRKALTEAKRGKPMPRRDCPNPVDKDLELVHQFGLQGTPAIVLEDGRLLPGYVPPDRLSLLLDGMAVPRRR